VLVWWQGVLVLDSINGIYHPLDIGPGVSFPASREWMPEGQGGSMEVLVIYQKIRED